MYKIAYNFSAYNFFCGFNYPAQWRLVAIKNKNILSYIISKLIIAPPLIQSERIIKLRAEIFFLLFVITTILKLLNLFDIKYTSSIILLLIGFILNYYYQSLIKNKKFTETTDFISQIFDIILITFFIYTTGNIYSPFYLLYYFIIFIAAYKFNRIGSLFFLVIIVLCYYFIIITNANNLNDYIKIVEFIKIISFCFLSYLFEIIKKFKDKTQQLNIIIAQKNDELMVVKRNLEIINRELEYKNIQYLDMIGFVSHELKNPLVSVMSLSELFKSNDSGNLTEEQVQALNVIYRNANNMRNMIDDYLNLVKLDQGEIEPKYQTIDVIQDIIIPTIEENQKMFDEKKMRVENETPAIFKGLTINSDKQLIKIVYQNLFGNGLKYGYSNSVIYYGVKIENNTKIFYVKNFGKPIPKESFEKIFEKFERLDRDSQIKGSGLGLFNCRKILNSLKGRIWCDSSESNETNIFYFTVGK